MPPRSLFDQDTAPTTAMHESSPNAPRQDRESHDQQTPLDDEGLTPQVLATKAKEVLGLEDVHVRGFFDDRPMLADDVDQDALRSDGRVFLGALLVGLLLIAGLSWVGLKAIADAQHHAPSPSKHAKVAAKGQPVDKRNITLSTTGLPPAPQVGQAITFPVLTDNTANVTETVLYNGDKVVARQAGLATSMTWTPKATGQQQLKVVFTLANGAQAVSPPVQVNVSAPHPGTSAVPPPILATANTLVDAINAKNWDAIRSIDPSKSNWRDSTFASNYKSLDKDTLVPVAVAPARNGVTRLYGGLFAQETSRVRLYCVTWDVNPADGTVRQVNGRQLGTDLSVDTTLADAEPRLVAACTSG